MVICAGVRFGSILVRHLKGAARETLTELKQLRTNLNGCDRLQLGSGEQPIPGWANIDLSGPIVWDLTRPLPIKGRTIRFIYSEHFIEHVTRDQARAILKNCREVMAPGGRIRISTPDVREVTSSYLRGELLSMPHGSWYPETLCRMLNDAFHAWGHQFIYDEPELTAMLREAGFSDVQRKGWRESDVPELKGLETRPFYGDLILEAKI